MSDNWNITPESMKKKIVQRRTPQWRNGMLVGHLSTVAVVSCKVVLLLHVTFYLMNPSELQK